MVNSVRNCNFWSTVYEIVFFWFFGYFALDFENNLNMDVLNEKKIKNIFFQIERNPKKISFHFGLKCRYVQDVDIFQGNFKN